MEYFLSRIKNENTLMTVDINIVKIVLKQRVRTMLNPQKE